ncbi:MAG TPA: hypothetical protein VK362_24280 [Reyranella sp.]|jgi:hypothetical protein|nr:hypothetical protein [Reyranella sp.]
MFDRVMKHGARILLGLSLPFFAIALLQFAVWLLQLGVGRQTDLLQQTAQVFVGMSWLYTLSSGGLFLAAAVIVDRFDRWLAEGRQPPVT